MKSILKLLCIFSAFAVQQVTFATVLIESKQGDGSLDKVYIKGSQVRIDSSAEPGYVLIDTDKGTMHAVNHTEKQVMNIGEAIAQNKQQMPNKTKFDIKFAKKGSGPTIAGYSTTHFVIMVNGQKCSDEYTSKKLMNDLGVEKTFKKLMTMFKDLAPDMSGMMNQDPCMAAEQQISENYVKHGFPMRSVYKDGSLETEVVKTKKNASLPAGGFDFPKGYKMVDMSQMMQGMPAMPQMSPEQMKAMEDMEKMDPEKIKKLMDDMMEEMKHMGKPQ